MSQIGETEHRNYALAPVELRGPLRQHVYNSAEHYLARRQHSRPCDLCGDPIRFGEACMRWSWKDGPYILTMRVHRSCDAEARRFVWYGDDWPSEYPLREERRQCAAAVAAPLGAPDHG